MKTCDKTVTRARRFLCAGDFAAAGTRALRAHAAAASSHEDEAEAQFTTARQPAQAATMTGGAGWYARMGLVVLVGLLVGPSAWASTLLTWEYTPTSPG